MKENLLQLFSQYPQYALILSIAINVLIAIAGVLPSVFLTAANILFFGFWQGLFISFIGEALGAVVAFMLYRAGFKKQSQARLQKYPSGKRLLEAEGKDAFYLILSLRLIPFIPSGLVTFAAAIGRVTLPVFLVASSLGKIPALVIESYAAYQVLRFGWQGKAILFAIGCYLLYLIFKKGK